MTFYTQLVLRNVKRITVKKNKNLDISIFHNMFVKLLATNSKFCRMSKIRKKGFPTKLHLICCECEDLVDDHEQNGLIISRNLGMKVASFW